ncbi:MAG: hypothetical protein RLZZ44_858 [Bacteroidota bacterium]
MNLYHIWADKSGDISDVDWVNNMKNFLQHLVDEGHMHSFRITRCKMGFRSLDIPEWHIMMEFENMAQIDAAFHRVAPLEGELEDKHRSFNQFVGDNIHHALYRDWPDNV